MKVLFICKSNQFRSQMAAALYNYITGTSDAESAGTNVGTNTEPEDSVIEPYFRTSDFFEFMEEKGMHIRKNRTRKLLPEMLQKADIVVSMAEEPFVPDFLRGENVLYWEVPNPAFATREVVEETNAKIEKLVRDLLHVQT